jgi:hypothetical protein
MSNTSWPKAKLTTVALFPENYFLENLAVRADDTVLITALNRKELWYVPTHATKSAKPVLLHTFDQLSLTEVEPNVFYLRTSNAYTDHKSSLHRIDLRNWRVGDQIQPQKVLDFPDRARVRVNPETLDAMGEPEHVSAGRMADDFCIDQDAGVAYVTTHRENTIDCISLNPAQSSQE